MEATALTKRPAVRFEYDRMTGEQFSIALKETGIKPDVFARLFGMNEKTVRDILKGQADVPRWCPPVLEMLREEKARRAAFDTAALLIRADKDNPQRGPYPFQNGRVWED